MNVLLTLHARRGCFGVPALRHECLRMEADPDKGARLKETLEKWSGFTVGELRKIQEIVGCFSS